MVRGCYGHPMLWKEEKLCLFSNFDKSSHLVTASYPNPYDEYFRWKIVWTVQAVILIKAPYIFCTEISLDEQAVIERTVEMYAHRSENN